MGFRSGRGVCSEKLACAIRKAMKYIREHQRDQLTVESVARAVGMSPSHFAHRFREIARVSPMKYVKHVRLHEARRLMLAEGTRASGVAELVGYASISHFSRDFRTQFGESPRRYLHRLLGDAERLPTLAAD
jgi:AraC-like DNA-binding protein